MHTAVFELVCQREIVQKLTNAAVVIRLQYSIYETEEASKHTKQKTKNEENKTSRCECLCACATTASLCLLFFNHASVHVTLCAIVRVRLLASLHMICAIEVRAA